jgi:predicted DNA-binding transcriptional regulator AlpA
MSADRSEVGPLPALVDADRFARELSMARRTFDRYVAAGVLPQPDVRLSRKVVRWRKETVAAAIDQLAGQSLSVQ